MPDSVVITIKPATCQDGLTNDLTTKGSSTGIAKPSSPAPASSSGVLRSKPPLNSTDCGSDVSPSRDNRRQAAYAAYARYAALKPHTPYKFGLLGPEYEIDPGMWQARAQDMQQQAAKAAQENAALLAHCHQLTSQLSSLQGLQLDNKKLLARNEQLLGNCNLLREQLGRSDELLSLQRLKQQQRRGHNSTTAAAGCKVQQQQQQQQQ